MSKRLIPIANMTIRKSAIISSCSRYRYELRREWDQNLPPLVFGMLNPSTADAQVDDPTIIRNVRRAQANGCGSLIVWNLGAGRATNPSNWMAMDDPIGPENDLYIRANLTECRARHGIAVIGWGALGSFLGRDKVVLQTAEKIGVDLYCLGITKRGQPKHPLYVADSLPLVGWKGVVENFKIIESSESLTSP
jgi:hypothetical protein